MDTSSFGIIAIIDFIIFYAIYSRHYDKLANPHPYSMAVDVLAWVGSSAVIYAGFLYQGIKPQYDMLLDFQIVFAVSVLNIHLARCIIRNKKYLRK